MRRPLAARSGPVLLAALALAGIGASCAAEAPLAVDGARAHARVVSQVEMGPRIPGTPGHARVREWLTGELRRLGGTVREQRFTDTTLGRPLEIVNLIATWPGSGSGPRRRVVLAAHYDTRAIADQDPDPARRGEPVPGANDGGSGVAVLLEVAELLAKRPAPIDVELVFFDAEDQGGAGLAAEYCLGSRGYAARLPAAGRPVAAFVFDMIGDADLGVYREVTSNERAANLTAMAFEGARAVGATSYHDEPRHQVFDDHVPLLDAGLPAVDLIDFEYPAWHTTRDLPDRVSPASLAQSARLAAWLVYRSPLARPR